MSDALFDATTADIATRNADIEARKVLEQNKRASRFHNTYAVPKARAEKALRDTVASSPKLQTFLEGLWTKQNGREGILLVVDYWKRSKPLGLVLFKDGLTFEVWILDNSENFLHECGQDELMSAIEFNHLPFTNEFEKLAEPKTAFEVFLGRLPFRNM